MKVKDLAKYINTPTKVYAVKDRDDDPENLLWDMIVLVRHDTGSAHMDFIALDPCSSTSDNGQPQIWVQLVCSGKIKWDLCSHMYFTGEDSMLEDKPDSYYHVCGDYSYTKMAILPCALLEIAKKTIETNFNCGDKINPVMESFLEVFRKNYTIEEIDPSKYIFDIYLD